MPGNTVSIVIATYNGEKYIEAQIQSILRQTVLPDEIVIIDDASQDHTVKILQNLLKNVPIPHMIKVHDTNRGITQTFQEGISQAKCDYVMICDQDDVWKEEKIETCKQAMDSETSLVICNAAITDSDLRQMGQSMFQYIRLPIVFSDRTVILPPEEMLRMSLRRNYATGMCMTGRREDMLCAFPIPKAVMYDAWLAWNLANLGNTKFIRDELVFYRQHGNNAIGVSRNKVKLREYYQHRRNDLYGIMEKYRDLNRIELHSQTIKTEVREAISFYQARAGKRSVRFRNLTNVKLYKKYSGRPGLEMIKDFVSLFFIK